MNGRDAIRRAIADLVEERIVSPTFDQAWGRFRFRLEQAEVSRADLIRIRDRTTQEFWRLLEDLPSRINGEKMLEQFDYELERCA